MDPYTYRKIQIRAPPHGADSLMICFDCASRRANVNFLGNY